MQVEITYTRDTGEKLVNETFGPNNIRRKTSGSEELHSIEIRDGRTLAGELHLDKNGFQLIGHRTAVKNFFDPEALKTVYYPEVEKLIREVSGARRAVVFDHTLRSGDESEREARLIREPVLSAHNDYTEWSGPQRVRDLLPDEAAHAAAKKPEIENNQDNFDSHHPGAAGHDRIEKPGRRLRFGARGPQRGALV